MNKFITIEMTINEAIKIKKYLEDKLVSTDDLAIRDFADKLGWITMGESYSVKKGETD